MFFSDDSISCSYVTKILLYLTEYTRRGGAPSPAQQVVAPPGFFMGVIRKSEMGYCLSIIRVK